MELEERSSIIEIMNKIALFYENISTPNVDLLIETKKFLDQMRLKTSLKRYDFIYSDLINMIDGILSEKINMDDVSLQYTNFRTNFIAFRDDYISNRDNNFKLSFVYVTARIEMAAYHAKMILEYNGDVDIEVVLCHNYNQEIDEHVEINIDDPRFRYVKNDNNPYGHLDMQSYTYNVIHALKSATGDFVFPLSDKDFVVKENIDFIHYMLQNTYDATSVKSFLCTDGEKNFDNVYNIYEKGFDATSNYFINYALSGCGYKRSEIEFGLFSDLLEKDEDNESFQTYIQAYLGFEMCFRGNVIVTSNTIAVRDYEYINNRKLYTTDMPQESYLMRPYTPRGRFEAFKGFAEYFSRCGFSESEFAHMMKMLIGSYFPMMNSAYIKENEYKNLDISSLENNLIEFKVFVQNLLMNICTSEEVLQDILGYLNGQYVENLSAINILKENLKITKIFLCRVCDSTIYLDKPMITYDNVPDRSQNLLKADELQFETNKTLKVYQCEFCNTVQLDGKPLEHFEEVVRTSGVSEIVKKQKTEQFQNFIDKYELDNKKILEVGCGNGDYLEIVNNLNVDAYGIEYSQKNVDICGQKGLQVRRDYIFAGYHKTKPFRFDAFYCIDYLEHIPTPNIFLKGIYNNTTDDAVGIIEVPNFYSIVETKAYSEFRLENLVYYTIDTLTLLLNKNGFEVLEYKESDVISVVVKKRKK